jgi:Sperm tail
MNEYTTRAIRDLDAAEQKQRKELERKHKDILEVLIQLAHALRGEAFEAARSKDPYAPFNWTRSDWNVFWFGKRQLVPPKTAATWANAKPDTIENDSVAVLGTPKFNALDVYQALQASSSIEDLRAQMEATAQAHQQELERKNQHIQGLSKSLKAAEKLLKRVRGSFSSSVPGSTAMEIVAPAQPVQELGTRFAFTGEAFKEEIALWMKQPVYDHLPNDWKSRFTASQSEARILIDYQLLFVMYSCGISCKHRIGRLISVIHSSNPDSTKSKKGYHDLRQEEMIAEYSFHLYEDAELNTHIPYYALTKKGQQLCEDWGLPQANKRSAFEQALADGIDTELPAVQTLLAFSFYAFMRRWKSGYIQNDLSMEISNGTTTYRVIAAPKTIPESAIKASIEKMTSNSSANIGLVTLSSARRKKYAEWTKNNGFPVAHTNIYHLINKEPDSKTIVPFTEEDYAGDLPLWIES